MPHTFPQATDLSTVKRILEHFLEYPKQGGAKISDFLLNQQIAYVSPTTAQKIKNKANQALENSEYKLSVLTRYEALQPNDIWAIDFIEFDWYGKTIYIALLIDDHSRFVLNWCLSTNPTTFFAAKLIDDTIKQYGKPKVIKSDNGPQFRKSFKQQLNKQDIYHLNSPAYRPQYNGKLERLNKDIDFIIDQVQNLKISNITKCIDQTVKEHNCKRPHQSLGGITPEQRHNGKERQIKQKMKQFRQKELNRNGLNYLSSDEVANYHKYHNLISSGIIKSIKREGKKIISVRFFSEIFLQKDLD